MAPAIVSILNLSSSCVFFLHLKFPFCSVCVCIQIAICYGFVVIQFIHKIFGAKHFKRIISYESRLYHWTDTNVFVLIGLAHNSHKCTDYSFYFVYSCMPICRSFCVSVSKTIHFFFCYTLQNKKIDLYAETRLKFFGLRFIDGCNFQVRQNRGK